MFGSATSLFFCVLLVGSSSAEDWISTQVYTSLTTDEPAVEAKREAEGTTSTQEGVMKRHAGSEQPIDASTSTTPATVEEIAKRQAENESTENDKVISETERTPGEVMVKRDVEDEDNANEVSEDDVPSKREVEPEEGEEATPTDDLRERREATTVESELGRPRRYAAPDSKHEE
ncbi:hypothetical protein QR680_002560 [Steinernema hermaphroditum]|uniref:Secreted mucin n=1 Tax=Steinernema hermaphroditum TaxID=289476 RepID=A0AA39H596_9BILA|nr:hypothetical protein QR680_002560 [Steinernema hermaphroditum]